MRPRVGAKAMHRQLRRSLVEIGQSERAVPLQGPSVPGEVGKREVHQTA